MNEPTLQDVERLADMLAAHKGTTLSLDIGATWFATCTGCSWRTAPDLRLIMSEADRARWLHMAEVALALAAAVDLPEATT